MAFEIASRGLSHMSKPSSMICAICAHSFRGEAGVGAHERCPRCGAGAIVAHAPPRRPRGKVLLAALIILGVAATALAARAPITRAAPAAARVYAAIGLPVNLRGVSFEDVKTSLVNGEGGRVLTIEGALVNLRDGKTEAADMRIALRDAASHEIYAWTAHAPKAVLAPREQAPFRLRLAAPPIGATEVMVRFATSAEEAESAERRL
jgi:hypothetical protein